MSLTTQLGINLNILHTKTPTLAAASATDAVALVKNLLNMSSGTGVDQADKIFYVSGTVASGSPQDYNVYDTSGSGGVKDIFGDDVAMRKIKMIYLFNSSTTAGDLVKFGPGASNGWFAFVDSSANAIIGPAGGLIIGNTSLAGYTVDSTHKVLRVSWSAGSASIGFDMVIVGTSV